VIDHVAGAESDSGLTIVFRCPSCGYEHKVALNTLGRFAFSCGLVDYGGNVDAAMWQAARPFLRGRQDQAKGLID